MTPDLAETAKAALQQDPGLASTFPPRAAGSPGQPGCHTTLAGRRIAGPRGNLRPPAPLAATIRSIAQTACALQPVWSPLGTLVLAATPRGLAACVPIAYWPDIVLPDQGRPPVGAGEAGLPVYRTRDFAPDADRAREAGRAHSLLCTAAAALGRYFSSGTPLPSSIPLDLDSSSPSQFRKQVWMAATRIPFGKTVTYTELARAVGADSAARAVAGALASNPLLIWIPCHRVVSADSRRGGYSAGMASKSLLLELERTASARATQ
jgi:O-6-methylguanine DNA methyltransferase